MKISSNKSPSAFTLFELLASIFIVMAMASVVLPHLARAKCRCQRINCVNNLKQIGVGVRTWALDNGDKCPMHVSVTNGGTMELINQGLPQPHFEVMSNELSTPKILICPKDSDGNRISATTFSRVLPPGSSGQVPFTNGNNVSYFVGVDVIEDSPQSVFCGDDNFTVDGLRFRHRLIRASNGSSVAWTPTRHSGMGNLLFSDGSVLQANSKTLAATLSSTNRLAMP